MEHLVTKIFSDKELGLFLPNSYFNCEDYERIESLSSLGFIIPNIKLEELKQVEVVKEEPVKESKPKQRSTPRKQTRKAVDKDVTES